MNKFLRALSVFSFILITSSTVLTASAPAYKLFNLAPQQGDRFKKQISNYTLLTLNQTVLNEIYQSKADQVAIEIPLSLTQTLTFNLKKSRVMSDGFIISTPEGEVPYSAGLFYHGAIAGVSSSTGSFSLFDHSVMAVMSDLRGNYVIGTTSASDPNATEYIIYNDADMLVQNPFECHVDDDRSLPAGVQNRGGDPVVQTTASCRSVELYLECDYNMYVDKGSNITNVVNYTTAVMNEVALIYANESINISIKQIMVWTTADPYPDNSSSAALMAFQSHLGGVFNGDLAHLLSTTPSNLGGVSFVDVLCNQQYGVGYSNIYNTFNTIPTYSWTVEVISHEMGHGFGSQHTHWCGWQLTPTVTGPIDTCYTPEGGCYTGSAKPKTGTIMSYCHLNAGISFALGFGPLPGNQLRSRYNAATCAVNSVSGTLTASSSGAICAGNTANFTATAAAGSAFAWTGPAGFVSSVQNPSIANAQLTNAGTYNVTATYNGCTSDPATATLVVNTVPAAAITPLGATNICTGGSVMLSANTGTGITYQWKKGANLIAGATSSSYLVTAAGTYRVIESTTGGCSKISSPVVITGPPAATVSVSGSLTFCAGGSVVLTAAAGTGYTYQWKLNNVNITGATTQSYIASAAGSYKCLITNAFGCTKISQTKTVTINCRLSADVSQELVYLSSPNPFTNSFTINFNDNNGPAVDVKIYDVIGKQLHVFRNQSPQTGLTAGEDLNRGIFIIEITQGDKKEVLRLVKK